MYAVYRFLSDFGSDGVLGRKYMQFFTTHSTKQTLLRKGYSIPGPQFTSTTEIEKKI